MAKVNLIDQRGDLYDPKLSLGFPRDNRRLVLGISGPGICPGGEDYDKAIAKVRRALRGMADCVLVLLNYEVAGYAAIEN